MKFITMTMPGLLYKNTRNLLLLLFALSTATLQSCYYDVEEELYPNTACETTVVTFAATIQPILARNCVSCHNGPSGNGGVNLATHAGVAAVATNGRLTGAITHASGFSPMPQGASKLPACNIEQIIKWVNDGAPNN